MEDNKLTNNSVSPELVKPSGASFAIAASLDDNVSLTYSDKSITYTGDLKDFDYNAILRQKQSNIYNLYQ